MLMHLTPTIPLPAPSFSPHDAPLFFCSSGSRDGRQHPHGLNLRRRVKEKLWQRLNRPVVPNASPEEGLSAERPPGAGDHPPHSDIDVSDELLRSMSEVDGSID